MNIATRIEMSFFLIVASGMSLYLQYVYLQQGYVRAKQSIVVRANDTV